MDSDKIPPLDAKKLTANLVAPREPSLIDPMLLVELTAADGTRLFLCDFGSAGSGGSPYRSWLHVENTQPTEFSRSNPLRSRAI